MTDQKHEDQCWYVVQAQLRKEALALEHLAKQGFNPFLPRIRRTVRHARKFDHRLDPLFPGYIFVRFDPDSVRWRSINGTIGVVRLLADGDRPLSVEGGFVEDLISHSDRSGVVMADAFDLTEGQEVELQSGPFSGMIGKICQVDGPNRVRMLMQFVGRSVEITADTDQLAPVKISE